MRRRPDSEPTVDAFRQILAPQPVESHSKWPKRAALLIATVGAGTWIWRKTQARETPRTANDTSRPGPPAYSHARDGEESAD